MSSELKPISFAGFLENVFLLLSFKETTVNVDGQTADLTALKNRQKMATHELEVFAQYMALV